MDRQEVSINKLVYACAYSHDASEWGELVRQCSPLVTRVVLRISRLWPVPVKSSQIEDIVQEVFLKLCENERRILRDFEPRCEDSFFGLLRIVTASVVNDYFRRTFSTKRGGKVITMPLLEEGASTHVSSLKESAKMQRVVLYEQIDQKLRGAGNVISSRDLQIFWLYYLHGFTADEISKIPEFALSPKGVESALRRIVKWVRDELDKPKPISSPNTQNLLQSQK